MIDLETEAMDEIGLGEDREPVDGHRVDRRQRWCWRLLGKAAAPAAKDQHEGQDHARTQGGHYERGTSLAPRKFRRASL